MSEHGPSEREYEPEPEIPALREFAEQFLAPHVLALDRAGGVSMAFVDQLHRALPEAAGYVLDALAGSEDPALRREAIPLLLHAVECPNPRTLDTLRALMDDPDASLGAEALLWVEALSGRPSQSVGSAFRHELRLLASQARTARHRARIEALRDAHEQGRDSA